MVEIEDVLQDVEDILQGKYDSVDESKLLYKGSLNGQINQPNGTISTGIN